MDCIRRDWGGQAGRYLIHGGDWDSGDPSQILGHAREIADAGFFVADVWYELAPNADIAASPSPVPGAGYIPGQPCHENDGTTAGWRMKQQIDDIKDYVKAMRADSRCNQWVAVVGGSAGATHAITVALDTNPSPSDAWPHWFHNNVDDRPDCAVMLSAIYDFSDWTPPTYQTTTDAKFYHYGMHNYAQGPNPITQSSMASLPLNPVNLIAGAVASTRGFIPIYMINSYIDHPTAYHQLVTMICHLQSAGLTLGTDYKYLTIPGAVDHLHSFQYWNSWDHLDDDQHTVGDDVIAFLKAKAGI